MLKNRIKIFEGNTKKYEKCNMNKTGAVFRNQSAGTGHFCRSLQVGERVHLVRLWFLN